MHYIENGLIIMKRTDNHISLSFIKGCRHFIKLFLFGFLILFPYNSSSQIVYSQGSPDADKKILSAIKPEQISFDPALIDSMRRAFYEVPGNSTFAISRKVDYNPANSGTLVSDDDGRSVWYLGIKSENALSLNIIFSKFALQEGEEIFVYDNNMQTVLGPFTWLNNKQGRGLALMPVPGQQLIIEYHMNDNNANTHIEVGQLAHGFAGPFADSPSKDYYFGQSQPCNVDINCEPGSNWQLEKGSVVRIIAGGTELGSGFLVNNTAQQNIAYLVTANHVIRTAQYAENSVFVFRYESPYCDGPDGRAGYSLSGSELRAEDANTDFTLVRLDDFPPVTYKPYLAGWDVSGNTPANTVTIHHPSGDVKKISTDNDPPVIATFQNLYTNGFWKILQWDQGTTEGGSSGSPLFDQNHRAVGLLTGGEAVCGNSVNDYYARMDIIYDRYTEQYRSLMPWLDPAMSGVTVLNGRDPYMESQTGFDTLCNCPGDERYITAYELPGTGYTTGFNSDSIVMFAEKFTLEPGRQLTGVIFDVALAKYLHSYDSISLYVMESISEPGSVIANTAFNIIEAQDSSEFITDFFIPVQLPETFYLVWHLWYSDNASAEQQQFAIFHGPPVSISQNTAYFKDRLNWHPFYDHPYQGDALNLCVRVVTALNTVSSGPETVPFESGLAYIYPNPVSDKLNIKLTCNIFNELRYSVFDYSGKTVLKGSFFAMGPGSVHELDVSALPAGIYHLTLESDNAFSAHKVIIR